jgi:hypothetical protein
MLTGLGGRISAVGAGAGNIEGTITASELAGPDFAVAPDPDAWGSEPRTGTLGVSFRPLIYYNNMISIEKNDGILAAA